MLSDHLEKNILLKIGKIPTNGQKQLIKQFASFVLTSIDNDLFLITGYAGTGKTTAISAIINALEELKIKTILMAPTGRAAKVLSSFSGKPAHTIHKNIYRQKSSNDGFGKFVLGKNLSADTFFIVDEASMIGNKSTDASIFGSGNLLDDLLSFVYTGKRCRLVLIGDSAQLPPVNSPESPALNTSNLKSLGFSVQNVCLTDVVRQTLTSGILNNATKVRNLISENRVEIPNFITSKFTDIINLSGVDLISELDNCYGKYGEEQTMVVTRSNKRANLFNAGIRKTILFREEQISASDYLMVVKNNYYWLAADEELNFIANGDIIQVVKLSKFEERYGFHFVNAKIRLNDLDDREIDVKVILETLDIEGAALTANDNKKLYFAVFEDYKHLKPKKAVYDAIRNDPYFNALQVKFAYAITCHKAQGGQWKAVFVDQGYFVKDMLNIEYLRWMYTAITRASERLYLVNFNKDFLEPD
jgi:exodeoxyribonuclease-5